ncbi:hypothetical protein JHK87_025650 [Glycine soja]|nr:hypothetical protein JHK87_025650 [Glycine soja]
MSWLNCGLRPFFHNLALFITEKWKKKVLELVHIMSAGCPYLPVQVSLVFWSFCFLIWKRKHNGTYLLVFCKIF